MRACNERLRAHVQNQLKISSLSAALPLLSTLSAGLAGFDLRTIVNVYPRLCTPDKKCPSYGSPLSMNLCSAILTVLSDLPASAAITLAVTYSMPCPNNCQATLRNSCCCIVAITV